MNLRTLGLTLAAVGLVNTSMIGCRTPAPPAPADPVLVDLGVGGNVTTWRGLVYTSSGSQDMSGPGQVTVIDPLGAIVAVTATADGVAACRISIGGEPVAQERAEHGEVALCVWLKSRSAPADIVSSDESSLRRWAGRLTDVGAPVRHGEDQPAIPQLLDGPASRTAAYPELLPDARLAGDRHQWLQVARLDPRGDGVRDLDVVRLGRERLHHASTVGRAGRLDRRTTYWTYRASSRTVSMSAQTAGPGSGVKRSRGPRSPGLEATVDDTVSAAASQPEQDTGASILLGRHSPVHRHRAGFAYTECGWPVRAGARFPVSDKQIMVYKLAKCQTCYPGTVRS